MEGPKNIWIFVLFIYIGVGNANAKRSSDEDIGPLPSRLTRNKQNGGDRKQELFDGIPDPESSAQQVSPAISGYNTAGLGGQNGLLGVQGLYTGGIQAQGYNPGLTQGLGQGQNGLINPYLGNGGIGVGGVYQNPYAFLGTQGQDLYSQQGIGLGSGGIYNQQGGFGTLGGGGVSTGLYNTNPYLTQFQNPYLTNQYLQGGGVGGVGINNQYPYTVNPYLFSRNTGYLGNPYLALGGGAFNPYTNINPYNNFPLASRFGLGRGGLGSRSNGGQSSSSSSSNDE